MRMGKHGEVEVLSKNRRTDFEQCLFHVSGWSWPALKSILLLCHRYRILRCQRPSENPKMLATSYTSLSHYLFDCRTEKKKTNILQQPDFRKWPGLAQHVLWNPGGISDDPKAHTGHRQHFQHISEAAILTSATAGLEILCTALFCWAWHTLAKQNRLVCIKQQEKNI